MESFDAEVHGARRRFLLDGAHNQAGVEALVHSLTRGYQRRRLVLVWGNMADKDLLPGLLSLLPLSDRVIFTRAEPIRSAAPEALLGQLSPEQQRRAECAATVADALARAAAETTPDDLICVAGSLYLVGRVRQLLLGEDCA
jgi:dihydrofolate synthase/folylpolyglutamate synthase